MSSDPVLDIFANGELKTHTGAFATTGPIGQAYTMLDPQKSVLLSQDCGAQNPIWCGQADLSFASVFQDAVAVVNRTDTDTLAQQWYTASGAQDPLLCQLLAPFPSLAGTNIQLVAIANRLDLASFDGTGTWTGAEIHFIYGPVPASPGAPNLTINLEFVMTSLGALDFQALALHWAALSHVSSDQYFNSLEGVLKESGVLPGGAVPRTPLLVRSRMNHELGGQWRFSQLLLDPKASAAGCNRQFCPAPLDDQISLTAANSGDYLQFWSSVETYLADRTPYRTPATILEGPRRDYPPPESPDIIGTPSGLCGAADRAARNMIGLQECTGCHLNETGTNFAHVHNRTANAAAELSTYLTGPPNAHGTVNVHPALADLYSGIAGLPVKVDYSTPGCATSTNSTNRLFHDLARRTLFLAQVATGQGIVAGHGSFGTRFVE